MEPLLYNIDIQPMRLTPKGRIYALIIAASIVFSLSSIVFGFFPYFGVSVSFISFALLAFYIKKDKTLLTNVYFVIALVLSIFLSIRSEPSVTMLNIPAIFYFGSFFVLNNKVNQENIFSIIFAPLFLFLQSIFIKNEYFLELKDKKSTGEKRENTFKTIVVFLTTLGVLAVILPLLASTNPYFNKLLLTLADFIGLGNVVITEFVFKWIIRLIFFIGLIYLIPRVATFMNIKERLTIPYKMNINLLIPKITVAIVLIVFFITQFQLYFSSSDTLQALGYTYSNYANEVFAQLSVVAVIVMGLLYADSEKKKINDKIALILIIEGVFLAFMAYKSVYEYSSAWGFTYKRLYGFAVATWILGIFTVYLYTFLKNIEKNIFLTVSLVYTGIILILVNIANFDYLIYHFRRAATGSGVDYNYLSRLSPDSISFKTQLDEIVNNSTGPINENKKYEAVNKGLLILLFKIEYLQEKYSDPDIRGFNLLEYLQYKEIKEVDTKAIRERYTPTNFVQ